LIASQKVKSATEVLRHGEKNLEKNSVYSVPSVTLWLHLVIDGFIKVEHGKRGKGCIIHGINIFTMAAP
jgi:hypothetical protein